MTSTNNDRSKAIELMCRWLIGSGFSGFKFDTSFSLCFSRESEALYNGSPLPWVMDVHLLGDWWLGCRNEWLEKVEELGVGIEPDEPVKAFELAKLRWLDGARIDDVSVQDGVLIIAFENKTILSVDLISDDEYAVMLKEFGVDESGAFWSVTCEGDNFYYRFK